MGRRTRRAKTQSVSLSSSASVLGASSSRRDFDGGRTRARTLDPLIKSQLLYQLSYAPIEVDFTNAGRR